MKIHTYSIEITNIMSPLDAELIRKLVKEQIVYMQRKGIIENSHVLLTTSNLDDKSVFVDAGLVTDFQ